MLHKPRIDRLKRIIFILRIFLVVSVKIKCLLCKHKGINSKYNNVATIIRVYYFIHLLFFPVQIFRQSISYLSK